MTTLTTLWRVLESNYGLLVLAGMFYLGWKMSTWKGGIENRLAAVERLVESSMAGVERLVEDRIAGVERLVENRMAGVERLVERYTKKTDEIYTVIVGRFGGSVAKSDSPVRLSDYGADLSEKIDAKTVVDAYAEAVYCETDDMNAYEIQEHCFAFCNDRLLDDLKENHRAHFDKISNVAFEDGIEMKKLLYVLGLELRDRVFQMQDKSHDEVDEHSPA